MDEISSFWAGAQAHARHVDLPALANKVGGYRALERIDVEGLIELGVAPARAVAWMRARPVKTRGVALTLADPRYPEKLLEIEQPPPVLFAEGDLECVRRPGVAIVGTRTCTAYGVAMARQLGGALAAAGIPVVSGLARGIDAHAHRAAASQGRTIAVLAHGLDHTAPQSNAPLRKQILDHGGLVISAHPDEVPPQPHHFPVRNQWISGLSSAVVVVEAGPTSGALHTARAADAQHRSLWAFPGPVGAASSRGCLDLIRDGALVVVDVGELVADLTQGQRVPAQDWLQHLFNGGTLDEAARIVGWSVAQVLAELGRLELVGQVVRLPGQRYAPAGGAR